MPIYVVGRKRGLLAMFATGIAACAITLGGFTGIVSADDSPEFSAQAREAGLTEKQARALQGKVNGYLKRYKGAKQLSANEVSYDNGAAVLTVPLPGDRKARSIRDGRPCTGSGAVDGYLCVWEWPDYSGASAKFYACRWWNLVETFRWAAISFINNQYRGTSAWFHYYSGGNSYTRRSWAYEAEPNAGGGNHAYWGVQVCM